MTERFECRVTRSTPLTVSYHHSFNQTDAEAFIHADTQDFCVVDTRLKLAFPNLIGSWNKCYPIAGGEKCKSIDRVFELYHVMHALPFLPGCVRVFGGGALHDLVGYALSTSMPHLPLILYPTTPGSILAGHYTGSFAINWDRRKDRIMVQAVPSEIRIDPFFIRQYPIETLRKSFVLPISMGLALDERFFHLTLGFLDTMVDNKADWDSYSELIRESHRFRLRAFEKGTVLFPGETIANRIMDGSSLHMDYTGALGCGLVIESFIAWKLGIGSEPLFQKLRQLWGHVYPEAKDIHRFMHAQIDLYAFLSMLSERKELTFSFVPHPGRHVITKLDMKTIEWVVRDFFLGEFHWEGV